jgi:LacI family transcriptional regulator
LIVPRKTIHDVAKAAGVAIKTVSRVLNDEPNVRPETRARVLAAAEALNYQPSLSADDEGAACEMTEYLLANGHRKIGFLAGHPSHFASGSRLRGYRAALERRGIAFDAAYVKQGCFLFEAGAAAARELLTMESAPTAIFASNDDMAAGVLVAAHELAVPVPGRLSVAGFDDTHVSRIVWPRLTTIHQPSYELAHAATDLLLRGFKEEDAPKTLRLPYQLIVRDSTGPARS